MSWNREWTLINANLEEQNADYELDAKYQSTIGIEIFVSPIGISCYSRKFVFIRGFYNRALANCRI
ncbi:Unannotated [Lentimonas sp. CC19]|nr:Unannotated [Lentimonas sp. CC4]CAA6685189.1 Unannotated [Lentimonas sp. CC6]CAA6697707.1 Unannotated [Lentimonas sp. CC10]CAA6697745.1 Unannotated [Lentimonas sp. CC19]CAA7071212.1 Unannotated [Lentimonas sp. CC11]CAA7169609.1 Unannotated [Lentimonas sp. CC21]CAA7182110.1 Unannotated [Lentimonas sp. CC8]